MFANCLLLPVGVFDSWVVHLEENELGQLDLIMEKEVAPLQKVDTNTGQLEQRWMTKRTQTHDDRCYLCTALSSVSSF